MKLTFSLSYYESFLYESKIDIFLELYNNYTNKWQKPLSQPLSLLPRDLLGLLPLKTMGLLNLVYTSNIMARSYKCKTQITMLIKEI